MIHASQLDVEDEEGARYSDNLGGQGRLGRRALHETVGGADPGCVASHDFANHAHVALANMLLDNVSDLTAPVLGVRRLLPEFRCTR